MEETQSLPNSESCINYLPNKENIIDHQEMTTPSSLSIKTATETATTNTTKNKYPGMTLLTDNVTEYVKDY
jgi:hypothetical protein